MPIFETLRSSMWKKSECLYKKFDNAYTLITENIIDSVFGIPVNRLQLVFLVIAQSVPSSNYTYDEVGATARQIENKLFGKNEASRVLLTMAFTLQPLHIHGKRIREPPRSASTSPIWFPIDRWMEVICYILK